MDFALPEYTRFKDNKQLDHIPGKYGLPLIGDTFSFVINPMRYCTGTIKSTAPYSRLP